MTTKLKRINSNNNIQYLYRLTSSANQLATIIQGPVTFFP